MAPSAGHTIAFGHMGLQVYDAERSAEFYRDVIGLTEVEHSLREDAHLQTVTGYPRLRLEIALLVEPHSGALLELLEYHDVNRNRIDPATANPGTAHVCYEVDDVDAIHARALAAGHRAVNPPVTLTSGRWTGSRSVYLLDPDGIRVELVQHANLDAGDAATRPGVRSEAVFLVEVSFAPDAAERRPPYRTAHLRRIADLKRRGVIIEGGAFLDMLSTSILLIRAEDEEAAAGVAQEDIYMATGIWRDVRVRPFGRVAGTE